MADKNSPMSYEIHVRGHLNSRWSEWLDGLEMRLLENGEMVLFGPVADQAALLGVLNKLSYLNLTLLSANQVIRNHTKEPGMDQGEGYNG